jgi:hypothetical protein
VTPPARFGVIRERAGIDQDRLTGDGQHERQRISVAVRGNRRVSERTAVEDTQDLLTVVPGVLEQPVAPIRIVERRRAVVRRESTAQLRECPCTRGTQ